MGYGKKLKDYLQTKGISISAIAANTDVPVSVIKTSVRSDKALKYDHAVQVSKYCGIPLEDICGDIPENAKADEQKKDDDGELKKLWEQFKPILLYYAIDEEHIKEEAVLLLEGFYSLTDQGRSEMLKYLRFVSQNHLDHLREHLYTMMPEEKEEEAGGNE